MNKERRKQIEIVIKQIELAKDKLQNVLNEEEYTFDNMPENLQGSIRGEESQEAIDTMNEAIESIDEVTEVLNGLV